MLYCEKCRTLSPDGAARCQNCRRARLRPVEGADLVLLQRADSYAAGKIAERLDAAGLTCERTPAGKHGFSDLYDSEALPTDENLFVPFADLPAAQELSRQVREELAREQAPAEELEDMSPRKRLAVQIVSTLAFLILVMLVVFGADAFSNWLKSLLGL